MDGFQIPVYDPEALLDEWRDKGASRFLVEGLVPSGSLVVLGGDAKEGKSVLLTNLAVSIAKGAAWLGRAVEQGPVLWCAYEESISERADILSRYPGVEGLPIYTCFPHDLYIDEPQEEDSNRSAFWFVDAIDQLKPKLIVIDPLVAACRDIDMDSTGKGRQKLRMLKMLAAAKDVVVIVIHHLNKDAKQGLSQSRLAGSHQLAATASASWTMSARKDADGVRSIRVSLRGRGIDRAELHVQSKGITDFELLDQSGQSLDDLVAVLSSDAARVWKAKELEAALELGQTQVHGLLKAAKQQNLIKAIGKGKATAYRLVREDEPA